MTLAELATLIELSDEDELIYCFVDEGKLIASFMDKKGVEVDVLTPEEIKLLKSDELSGGFIQRKISELKMLATS